MRWIVVALGLLALGACVQKPMQNTENASQHGKSSLYRFIEPTGGAAYSQGDARYYEQNANPYGSTGGAVPPAYRRP